MQAPGEVPIARGKIGGIDIEGGREAEQLEIIFPEIGLHANRRTQTLKLSPQPQVSFTLGLLNLNPSFKPSRV